MLYSGIYATNFKGIFVGGDSFRCSRNYGGMSCKVQHIIGTLTGRPRDYNITSWIQGAKGWAWLRLVYGINIS